MIEPLPNFFMISAVVSAIALSRSSPVVRGLISLTMALLAFAM